MLGGDLHPAPSRRRAILFAAAAAAALVTLVVPTRATAQPSVAQPSASGGARGLDSPTAYFAPNEPAAAAKEGKLLRAYRLTGDAPEIDGILDETFWAQADSIDNLVQVDPDNETEPSQRTVVHVVYDDRFLYVAARAYDSEPELIVGGLGRRDSSPPSDRLFLSFDPRHDHLTSYIFEVNPSGVQADRVFFDDTAQNNDYSGVWEVQTRITDEGWTAEFRIPFSQMQFDVPPGEEVVWGFTVRRDIFRRGEIDRWVGLPRGEVGFTSRFGHLVFGERLDPPRRVEIQPFAFTRLEDDPTTGTDYVLNGGVDARIGLGTSATLSATVNPDFGQVELDPAVLNLSVFETFFPERRSFFLEDSGTFRLQYGQFPLFHSRRIGQRPGRIPLVAGDVLVERPEETTILGAAKVAGKTGDWTWGALSALTAREYASVLATTIDGVGDTIVQGMERLIEPLTSYNVVRVQRDVLNGSNVGAIATATVREEIDDAFTGGVDYNLRWGRNQYELDGHWVLTRAPFADGVRDGWGGATNFTYFSRYVGANAHFDYFSPNFRNTDLGFVTSRVDKWAANGSVSLRQPDPGRWFRNAQIGVGAGTVQKGNGLELDRNVNVFANALSLGFWNANAGITYRPHGTFDDLDTRGGPPIVRLSQTSANAFVGTDSRKSWQVTLGVNGSRDEEGGWSAGVAPTLRLVPSTQLQTFVSVGYGVTETVAQWITNRDVTGDGETDHVYGRLRQNGIDITARMVYAFHRDMTLELFAQPFVAVGAYRDIKRLAEPSSFEFEPAAIPFDPDFNRKSLRANAILRWEYLRGSTLYFVWNLSASDLSRPGEFSPFRDLGDALGGEGPQVFMIKATYWFGS